MTGAAGLSTRDVQTVREALAAGRRPKVVFTPQAGQIAGRTGQVVRLTDPAAGDDFVVVRFGHDELPFSPTEVAIPPRAPATKRAKPAPEPTPPAAASPPPVEVDDAPAASAPVPPPRSEPAAAPVLSPGVPGDPAPDSRRERARTAPSRATASTGQENSGMDTQDAPARRTPRQAKPKAPAGLTVTLAYTEGEWLIGATQGTRALAKPYVIKPAEALKFVALLDVPGVHEAVEQIIAAERELAKAHADKLRAELAEVEAKLAELS